MNILSSRTIPQSELDSHSLRNVLDSMLVELSVPFLEKRARSKSHKKTPLDELNAVIQEITNRERELMAAVGIAKMLLDRNDELLNKQKKYFEKKSYLKSSLNHHQKEIQDLKELILNSEEKYQQVNSELIKSEEAQIKLLAENKRILYENSLKNVKVCEKDPEIYENELLEVKSEFKVQNDYLLSTFYIEIKLESEKKIKNLEDSLSKSETAKSVCLEKVEKLERDLQKLTVKQKDFEELCQNLSFKNADLEEKNRELTFLSLRLKAQNEKFSEDLKLFETKTDTSPKIKVRRHVSLKSELESIEEITQDSIPHHSYSLSRGEFGTNSLDMSITQSIAYIASMKNKETAKRKDPSEEYFILITQAIKLNSPYMDAICIIPPNELYQKALSEDIPFHKWHIWVESQLNSAYIQNVYNTDKRGKKYNN